MKALTLLRPWAYCIAHLDKRIENRTWAPWAEVIGQRIAIHSGKGIDADGFHWLCREGLIRVPLASAAHIHSAIVCTAVVTGFVQKSKDPWFTGPYGWLLTDVVTLDTPVPCRGMQGLWRVPDHVVCQLVAEVRS